LKKLAASLVFGCAFLATGVAGAATGRTATDVNAVGAPTLHWGVADDGS
jgi:hypothetical protein